MTRFRVYIAVFVLAAGCICQGDSAAPGTLTSAEYQAQLEELLSATQQLDSSGAPTPQVFRDLPPNWHIRAKDREFEISTEGLRQDLQKYQRERNVTNATAIRTRLQALRREAAGFEQSPHDVTAVRTDLNSILSRPEFCDGCNTGWLGQKLQRLGNWLDGVKRVLLDAISSLLRHIFRSIAIPTVSRILVYGVMALAILGLAFVAYRSIWVGRKLETVVPGDLPVSAKEWTIWLGEARAAAARREWREAIHLAYWAGISFLERQGTWKPDKARTPREYLQLLAHSGEQYRDTLTALTRTFELAWYAKRDASEGTFSQALLELEKLGCR